MARGGLLLAAACLLLAPGGVDEAAAADAAAAVELGRAKPPAPAPPHVPRLALRGGGATRAARKREEAAGAADLPAKRARLGRAAALRGSQSADSAQDRPSEDDASAARPESDGDAMSSLDTAQVDEAYSLLGGSEAAGDVEEVDYVDLAESSESGANGSGARGSLGGNRTVLHAFGENSIFSGITLYNDTLGCGRQRTVRAEDANRALMSEDDSQSPGDNATIDFELFDPAPHDTEGLSPLLQGLLGPTEFQSWQLARDIVRQGHEVGALQKLSNDSEPLGVASVLSLERYAHRSWCRQLLNFIRGYCPPSERAALHRILGAPPLLGNATQGQAAWVRGAGAGAWSGGAEGDESEESDEWHEGTDGHADAAPGTGEAGEAGEAGEGGKGGGGGREAAREDETAKGGQPCRRWPGLEEGEEECEGSGSKGSAGTGDRMGVGRGAAGGGDGGGVEGRSGGVGKGEVGVSGPRIGFVVCERVVNLPQVCEGRCCRCCSCGNTPLQPLYPTPAAGSLRVYRLFTRRWPSISLIH